jgi:hypothetical protein
MLMESADIVVIGAGFVSARERAIGASDLTGCCSTSDKNAKSNNILLKESWRGFFDIS